MNKDMMGVLPLGSVVLLKDAKRYLVVMGYLIIFFLKHIKFFYSTIFYIID